MKVFLSSRAACGREMNVHGFGSESDLTYMFLFDLSTDTSLRLEQFDSFNDGDHDHNKPGQRISGPNFVHIVSMQDSNIVTTACAGGDSLPPSSAPVWSRAARASALGGFALLSPLQTPDTRLCAPITAVPLIRPYPANGKLNLYQERLHCRNGTRASDRALRGFPEVTGVTGP